MAQPYGASSNGAANRDLNLRRTPHPQESQAPNAPFAHLRIKKGDS
jgi:hypothetical protein